MLSIDFGSDRSLYYRVSWLSDDDIGLAIAPAAICCEAFAGTDHPEGESLATREKGGGDGGIKIYTISNLYRS